MLNEELQTLELNTKKEGQFIKVFKRINLQSTYVNC